MRSESNFRENEKADSLLTLGLKSVIILFTWYCDTHPSKNVNTQSKSLKKQKFKKARNKIHGYFALPVFSVAKKCKHKTS